MENLTLLILVFTWITYATGRTEMVEPANPSVPMFVQDGGSFTLGCRNTLAKPIIWEKDGEAVSVYGSAASGRGVSVSLWVDVQFGERVTVSSLRVLEVSARHDQAEYSCRALDDDARPRTVQVFILALQTRDAQLTGRSWGHANNEATLRCNPEQGALFDATLTWYKRGGALVAPDDGDTTTMLLDNNRTLFFRDLTYPRDVGKIGKYECVLRLPLQGRTFAQNAYLKAAAIIDAVYAQEDERERVSVVCAGHAYPLPAVTWRKDNHVLSTTANGKYRAAVSEERDGGFVATLTLTGGGGELRAADYGNYTCMADSLQEDYESDDMKTLLLDAAYYGEIRTTHVSQAGVVIGILVAVVLLIYVAIVVVVVFLIYRRKRNERLNGKRLSSSSSTRGGVEEGVVAEESRPMLSVPDYSRPRRDTMSDTNSNHAGVPINGLRGDDDDLRGVSSDEDNASRKSGSGTGTESDDSIHKEKIPTTSEEEEDESESPNRTPPVFIMPPDDAVDSPPPTSTVADDSDEYVDETDVTPEPSTENLTSPSKPKRPPLARQQRPPSVEDILAAERDSKFDDNGNEDGYPMNRPRLSDDDEDVEEEVAPPPLPPKTMPQEEYLDMTGSLGRGSQRYSVPSRNGSRKLGDSPLQKDDDSSIDGDPHGETEVVIEPSPKDRFDTSV